MSILARDVNIITREVIIKYCLLVPSQLKKGRFNLKRTTNNVLFFEAEFN